MTNSTNRRGVLKGIAGVLGLATATAVTAGTIVKASKLDFDAAAYIDEHSQSKWSSERPSIIINKQGREIGVSGWFPDIIKGGWGKDSRNFELFKAELRKRGLIKEYDYDLYRHRYVNNENLRVIYV